MLVTLPVDMRMCHCEEIVLLCPLIADMRLLTRQ